MHIPSFIKRLPGNLRRVTSGSRYLAEIDGLRFLAILPVVFLHGTERVVKYSTSGFQADRLSEALSYFLSRGTVGVFLFFAISGFILGLPFARAFMQGRKPKRYTQFMLRRFTRLEPPYIFWMSFCFLVLLLQGNFSPSELLAHLAASLGYVHNLVFGTYSIINPVAWSLEVEFQFYLIAPVLAYLFFRIPNRRLTRTVLILVVFMWPMVKTFAGWHEMPYKASILGHFDHFMVGFLVLDLYLNGKKWTDRLSPVMWDVIGVIAYIVLFLTWSEDPGKGMVFNASLFGVMASALNGRMTRAFVQKPWIAAIGGMCYTIYLVHLPLFELLSSVSSGWLTGLTYSPGIAIHLAWQLTVLLLVAIPAYLLIEKPFMETGIRRTFHTAFGKVLPGTIFISRRGKTAVLFLFLSVGVAFGQQEADTGEPVELLTIDRSAPEFIRLKPLDEIIAYAERNSPLLKSSDLRQQELDQGLASIRREWTEYLFFNGSFSYGTSAFLDQTETPLLVDYRTTNRRLSFYNVGVSLRLPLSSIMQRQQKIRKIEVQKKIEEMTRSEIMANLRQAVIREYNTFRNKIKVIAVKNDKVQSLVLAAQYAEQLMQDGQIDLVEYTTIISRQAQTLEELENLRAEALLAYLVLNDICGGNITE